MQKRSLIPALVLILLGSTPLAARADALDGLPSDVTFLISGGSWEDPGGLDANGIVPSPKVSGGAAKQAKETRYGHYRLIAVQQPNRPGKVFLQQMQVTDSGSKPIDTIELREFSDKQVYITDIRTDDTSGRNRELGFFASVYLKTNLKMLESESWNVVIDEFGEIQVMRESH
ncbi:hypothetical protein [Allorhizobium terrae]|uniref:Type VI secretion system tube protein Hcp n=1 Tax=Allorhizobium terrae TaxID=1848972 RepID=A0A4S4A1P1_9HYPH|nr:hypothetical protein [Allorhizobium terrae]THF52269.1 hypothetical protein E6C51_05550 [Allorhizobium terrae]TWD57532.1 hypothetical protein FB480_101273 [Agrobacterium vitis]